MLSKYSSKHQQIKSLNNKISDHYKRFGDNYRKPIMDGIVDIDEYYSSPIKLLWILKEPYDIKSNSGGGWSMVKNIRHERAKGLKKDSPLTWHPITYISSCIQNNIDSFKKLDKSKIYSEYSKALLNLATINIQKLPAKKRSNNNRITKAYKNHRAIILDQIKVINPDVIIHCADNNSFKLLSEDLKQDSSLNIKTIKVYHPWYGYRKYEGDYIDDILHKIKLNE